MLSVRLLKRRLLCYQYWAIALICFAIGLVGAAGIASSSSTSSSLGEVILGLVLILISQVVLAFEIVLEERLMTEEGVSPFQLAAYEGLWGLACFIVLVPVLTYSPDESTSPFQAVYHEDFMDTLVQLHSSPRVALTCVAYMMCIVVYNVASQAVTKYLNAVVRSILEACRTMGVWVVDLLLFYTLHMSAGEQWSLWSLVELLGFGILICGTMSYKGILSLPCAPLPVPENSEF